MNYYYNKIIIIKKRLAQRLIVIKFQFYQISNSVTKIKIEFLYLFNQSIGNI